MSDTSSPVLDHKRPWLTDERELPSHMNWMKTLFDPTGQSPRLHFTRAWTLLFTLQMIVILVPFSIASVVGLAGGEPESISTMGKYATPVVFIITTLMSYVIHSRRLNDANKNPLLALIPLLPLLIALGAFAMTTMGEVQKYDQRFEARQEYLADPDAYLQKQRDQRRAAQEAAEKKAAEAAANGEEAPQQQRGQRRGPGGPGGSMSVDQPLQPKAPTVLKAALPVIQMIMIPLSGLIAIWSLMWVARVPYFGRYPGDDETRVYEA
ncbi:MAG: DUF805 domain-containing protein [Henriciella sp.]